MVSPTFALVDLSNAEPEFIGDGSVVYRAAIVLPDGGVAVSTNAEDDIGRALILSPTDLTQTSANWPGCPFCTDVDEYDNVPTIDFGG